MVGNHKNITDFENLVEEDVDMAGVFVHWK